MLRVNIRNAKEGMVLALPVRHPAALNQVLLKIGYPLEDTSVRRMAELGVRVVWVKYPSLACLDRFISEKVVEAHSNLIHSVASAFEGAQAKATPKMGYDTYIESIGKLINALVSNPHAAVFIGELNDGNAGDLMRHSSTVSYLSLLMGLKLGGYLVQQRKHIDSARAAEVTNLGLGAMQHDIGVMQLPDPTRELYGQSGSDLDPLWRDHTSLGYNSVRGNIAPSAATVILNHHQRIDGSDYAGGQTPILSGNTIHVFARIVGLADAFDELQFPVNGPTLPTVRVLQHLLQSAVAEQFDQQVLRVLLSVVPPFPPGSVLRLSDGQWAVAVDHNIDDPCRPLVQLLDGPASSSADKGTQGQFMDLTHCADDLHVVECDDHDVAEAIFEVPTSLRRDQVAMNWA